jgi:hypothetical protein
MYILALGIFFGIQTPLFSMNANWPENHQKLTHSTESLTIEANELMYSIKECAGMIWVITFENNDDPHPSMLAQLSATVLSDGKILTSFHSLSSLLNKGLMANRRMLLFFIPGQYSFDVEHELWNIPISHDSPRQEQLDKKDFWDSHQSTSEDFWNYTVPHDHERNFQQEREDFKFNFMFDVKDIIKEAFQLTNANTKQKHKESLLENEGKIILPYPTEIELFDSFNKSKGNKQHIHLIKEITSPIFDRNKSKGDVHLLPKTFKSINNQDDIAICIVTNQEYLPKSTLRLVTFSQNDIGEVIHENNKRNIFISSAVQGRYFFSGGSPQKKTSDMLLHNNALIVPIPQMEGCSGGALIVTKKNDDNTYNLTDIKIIGVVESGKKSQDSNTVNCCMWIKD